ncbi:hypothetical protein AMM49_05345 [Streptococcus agalactiae]|nr:hypothetical protein AMM49_05345 [Streptococcus agalactiae]
MTKKLIIAILALCTILTTSQAVLAKEKSQTVTIKNNYSVYIKKETSRIIKSKSARHLKFL